MLEEATQDALVEEIEDKGEREGNRERGRGVCPRRTNGCLCIEETDGCGSWANGGL